MTSLTWHVRVYRLLVVMLLPLIASCLTPYSAPNDGRPTARLDLLPNLPNKSVANVFLLHEREDCEPVGSVKRLAGLYWANKDPVTAHIQANTRAFIEVQFSSVEKPRPRTKIVADGTTPVASLEACLTMISFVPEPSRHYAIRATGYSNDCGVMLVDVASDVVPSSLTHHGIADNCRR